MSEPSASDGSGGDGFTHGGVMISIAGWPGAGDGVGESVGVCSRHHAVGNGVGQSLRRREPMLDVKPVASARFHRLAEIRLGILRDEKLDVSPRRLLRRLRVDFSKDLHAQKVRSARAADRSGYLAAQRCNASVANSSFVMSLESVVYAPALIAPSL